MPLSTLRVTPHDITRKTRGQDGFATSFPAGDLHPLQHAGLARRSPDRRLFDRDWRIVVRPHPIAAFRCDSSIVLVVLSLPANEWALRATFGPEHQG